MRILSLGPHFEVEAWQRQVIEIRSLEPDWGAKSLYKKIVWLIRHGNDFDAILIYRDVRLGALLGTLKRICRLRPGLVYQELFFDLRSTGVARPSITFRFRRWASLGVHSLLIKTMDAVIVHSSTEVKTYAEIFGVPESRFRFVPYFAYKDAATHPGEASPQAGYVLAPGRHRDFRCFIEAVRDTPWRAKIVAGESDRAEVGANLPENVLAVYEVSWSTYRDIMINAAVVVIPLFAEYWQRSLGQIALLEAWMMQKPVVAARTFQLEDYASEAEVAFYTAGDAQDLKKQIERLMTDSLWREQLVANGYKRAMSEFTAERYVNTLLTLCVELTHGELLTAQESTA